MTLDEISHTAEAWLSYWNAPIGSPTREMLYWVSDRIRDLLDREPDELWQFILLVHRKDQSPAIHQVLSAGPLEDLLSTHGRVFIERIEREAIADHSFAQLLGGVWRNRMSEDVWARVQAVWDRRGWDGIPE
jgi:hypothetical protein